MNGPSLPLRTCLRDPTPEIFEAERHLDDAVTAHLAGDHYTADELIRLADIPGSTGWTESLSPQVTVAPNTSSINLRQA